MKKIAFAFAACIAAFGSMGMLKAEARTSESVAIPFEFRVQQTTMPAGEYRIEKLFGSPLALLVNTKTGDRVYVFRDAQPKTEGKTTMTFERRDGVRTMKIS
jgi:hypothetical protein